MAKMNLKAARVNVDMTQKEVAKQLNVSNRTLQSWESGKTFPNAEKIDALCALYGVTYEDIIFLNNNSL